MTRQYLETLTTILQKGVKRPNRTGIDTLTLFGCQMRFNLAEGFPLLTTKKVYFKAIVYELLWFIKGDSNIKYLVDNGVNIWNEWPYEKYKEKILKSPRTKIIKKDSPYFLRINKLLQTEKILFKKLAKRPSISEISKELKKSQKWILDTDKLHLGLFIEKIKKDQLFAKKYGDLGPVYGKQWRNFGGVDQLKELVKNLKNNPFSRRHILTAWNPPEINEMLLPPCHCLVQFFVSENRELSCLLYQRSGDMFLGVPFNIASYSLLTVMIAQVCNYKVGEFIHVIGDAHIYLNHFEQVQEQLTRKPKKLPILKLDLEIKSLFDFRFEDISLENYDPYPSIKAKVVV